MNIEDAILKLMKMDDATWERHANPWSGWTRCAILPVLTVAIWSRAWIGVWALVPIGLCVLWIWLNPRAFGAPKNLDNWMSRSIYGERIWLARHNTPIPEYHRTMPNVLNACGFIALICYAIGLYQFDLGKTIFGLCLVILFKLWFLDRMVWLLRDTSS